MTQYINKSALVAEIEKYISNYKGILNKVDKSSYNWLDSIMSLESKIDVLQHILSFLDTLEVKEIGFDLGNNNKECHRVPSPTLKRLYMNEAKYELLKSDIMEGIVGDFEKGTTHNYLTIKIPMLLCPSNCAKGDKVKLIIIKEE